MNSEIPAPVLRSKRSIVNKKGKTIKVTRYFPIRTRGAIGYFHYVYRITNILKNKHYYGVHSSKFTPDYEMGQEYFSSSCDRSFILEQKKHPERFKYKIVKVFYDRIDANNYESFLHSKFDVANNPAFYNRMNATYEIVEECTVSEEEIKQALSLVR